MQQKRIITILLLAALAVIKGCVKTGDTDLTEQEKAYLRQKETLTFVSQTMYPPFEFLTASREHTGMCIELARWMGTELGFKSNFTNTSFQKAQEAVLSGQADVLTSFFYSQKRDLQFDFTQMMFQVPASIFVSSERPGITGIDDLNGRRIAMQQGDYAQEFLKKQGIVFETVYTGNFGQATDMVLTGDADAIVGDEPIVLYHLHTMGLSHQTKIVGDPLYVGENCMATKDDEHLLMSILNKGLNRARQSGALDRIEYKWLGIRPPAPGFKYFLHLSIAVAGLIAAILLVWIWNLSLRKRVRERTAEMIEAMQLNEKIIAKSPIGMSIYNESGQCIAANQAISEIIGAEKEQVLQQNYTVIESWKHSGLFDLAQKALTHNMHQRQEVVLTTSFGKKTVIDCQLAPLRMGNRKNLLFMATDMTEYRKMQEMMIQSEKMLSVGGLAAGMAHEVKNPLAGIIQTTSNISNRLMNTDLPANMRAAQNAGVDMTAIRTYMESRDIFHMIKTINESGGRVVKIVDNMLSFARKSDAVVSSHDITGLVDKALELAAADYDLKKQRDFRSIEIVKEYEEDLPLVPCEGSKIQQVMLNILRNGAQAMQEETGDSKKKKNHCFILRIAHEKASNMIRIEIEDNGPGMDEGICKHILEPFFTTKPAGEGTGLGLSVSYFIITENHGGTMNVSSKPGKGTVFFIRLPIAR